MFDTHSHLNFQNFAEDYAEVIKRSFNYGLKGIINVGSNFATSKRTVKIASQYEKGVYAAVGLHPIHVNEERFDLEAYKKLAQNDKVKAIGETGMDYYRIKNYDSRIKGLQRKVFFEHLKLAQELNLPVILHGRGEKDNPLEVYREMLRILSKVRVDQPGRLDADQKGVIHCFQADLKIAQEFEKLGFYIGFTGIITFPKIDQELLRVIKEIPLDKILLETDCPFLAPVPYRGQRCEPWQVKFIAQKIAEIKRISFEEVTERTTQNAIDLFGLKVIYKM